MADRPIVIIADSCGRHLGEYLFEQFIHMEYKLIWQPGLRLINVFNVVKSVILEYRPKLIYVLCGICDLTEISSHEPRVVLLRNPSTVSTVYSYITKLDLLHAQLFSLKAQIGHAPMIIFPTQMGMDLSTYREIHHDLIPPHQAILNRALDEINRYIVAQNNRMRITTPFLAAPVHIRCRGRYRHVYSKLLDGLHPSPAICQIGAGKLYENSLLNAHKHDNFEFVNQIYWGN